jgi:hypothetical protein
MIRMTSGITFTLIYNIICSSVYRDEDYLCFRFVVLSYKRLFSSAVFKFVLSSTQ